MEPPSTHTIRIQNRTRRRVDTRALRKAVKATLARHNATGEIAIAIAGDQTVRRLNRTYRGIDQSTDVLSFPPPDDFRSPLLGDVAIALPTAERQAALRGIAIDLELAYLGVHGTLHLLGFEDETDTDRDAMIAEMNRCAVEAGLPEDESWGSIYAEAAP